MCNISPVFYITIELSIHYIYIYIVTQDISVGLPVPCDLKCVGLCNSPVVFYKHLSL